MANHLEQAIIKALETSGNDTESNRAYLEFIKANFIIPVEKNSASEPRVLFLNENNQQFLPIFTDRKYLEAWGCDISDNIDLLYLSGVDLLKGIGDSVFICLNPGGDVYKEFNPAEIARMRSLVIKLFKKD